MYMVPGESFKRKQGRRAKQFTIVKKQLKNNEGINEGNAMLAHPQSS